MTTVFGADNKFEDLLHVFEGCSVDGLIFDGPLDYLNVTRCADSTFSYSIVGSIDVAGQGECPIEATETCGVPTGKTCGIAL